MNEKLNAIVGAKISEFKRKMADVKKTIRTIPKKTTTTVSVVTKGAEKRINLFQNRLAKLANTIRAIGTVMGNMMQGGMLVASPSLVPILASAAGLLGTLGPMIGVMGSNMVALAAAFGIAGGAALGFGAAAIPTITAINDGTAEATKENKKAMKALKSLKKSWQGVTDAIAPQVATAYGNAMNGVNKALTALNPMFTNVADTVSDLSARFEKFMGSTSAKDFFGYLNKNAAPILDKVMSGVGSLGKALMNLTVAFAPLTDYMAKSFANMGKEFANFTNSIKNSKGLENFISYVQTNGPKVWEIIKNIVNGLIGMFTAFGPLASDMMTGLQNLTAKFAEWGKTLGSNQQFQQFIGYIRDNAPTVLALIGNITTFLVNLGIAMAPLGAKILEMVNAFFAWSSSMLEAHPWIGKIFGGLLIGVGIFQMLTPLILAVTSLFSGFGTILAGVFTRIMPLFNTFKLLMTTGLKMLSTQLYLFGTRVLTTATTIVTGFLRMGAQAVVWAGKMALNIAKVLAQYAILAIKSAIHATKVALTFTVTMMVAAAKATASMIVSMGKFIAKYAWMGAQALVHAARVAASWVVAMGPVGWVIATIVGLVAVVIANWNKIKTWTVQTWNNVWSSVKKFVGNIWDTVKQKFTDIVNSVKEKMSDVKSNVEKLWGNVQSFLEGIDLFEIGQNIIEGLIGGIKAMGGKLVDAATGVVDNAIDGAKKLLGINSPSKVFFQFGQWTDEGLINGINSMRGKVGNATKNLASTVTNSFTPDIALADIGGMATFDTGINGSMGAIEHAFNAEVNDFELPEPQDQYAVINIGGHEAKGVIKYISGEQGRSNYRGRRMPK